MSLEARAEAATKEFQKLQDKYTGLVGNLQRLTAQKSENEAVSKEFEKLEPSNTVYKLVGPILMKQDQDEAKSNVQKRLEWITGEIERTEKALKQEQGRIEGKKMELVGFQQQMQEQQQGGQGAQPLTA